ncbi:MAG: heavy metal-associated domain-containing protein [Cypionkella sp.]
MINAPGMLACAACAVTTLAVETAARPQEATVLLSLPNIHCAGCLGQIEAALLAVPGVQSARENLSLRQRDHSKTTDTGEKLQFVVQLRELLAVEAVS